MAGRLLCLPACLIAASIASARLRSGVSLYAEIAAVTDGGVDTTLLIESSCKGECLCCCRC